MKKWGVWLALLVMLFFSFGCGSGIRRIQTDKSRIQQIPVYKGSKARIAVASFTCGAAKCNSIMGADLSDMLATALLQTGKFVVLEGGEGLKTMSLGQVGYVQQEDKVLQVDLKEGADILVIGTITAFEPKALIIEKTKAEEGKTRRTRRKGRVRVLKRIKKGKKGAYIATDIKLIDTRTGHVINATTVEGASCWKVAGITETIPLGDSFSVYKNTPMEKAIRVMLSNAVNAITQMVPKSYYRYRPIGVAYEGIVGGREQFVPGDKVLFAENFSQYDIGAIPTSLEILKGQVEVALFKGQKWLRALSEDVLLQKKINLSQDFAVEWDAYLNGSWPYYYFVVYLGNEKSSESLYWHPWESPYIKWSDQGLKTVKPEIKKIHHFVIQQKEGKVKIFVDGIRAMQAPINTGEEEISNRDVITIKLIGANPSEHKEILITNIKVTAYTK